MLRVVFIIRTAILLVRSTDTEAINKVARLFLLVLLRAMFIVLGLYLGERKILRQVMHRVILCLQQTIIIIWLRQ